MKTKKHARKLWGDCNSNIANMVNTDPWISYPFTISKSPLLYSSNLYKADSLFALIATKFWRRTSSTPFFLSPTLECSLLWGTGWTLLQVQWSSDRLGADEEEPECAEWVHGNFQEYRRSSPGPWNLKVCGYHSFLFNSASHHDSILSLKKNKYMLSPCSTSKGESQFVVVE